MATIAPIGSARYSEGNSEAEIVVERVGAAAPRAHRDEREAEERDHQHGIGGQARE